MPTTTTREQLPPSVRPAFAGCVLSVSELQTLRCLARGITYAEAAEEMCIGLSTVRSHLHAAYQRLGVSTLWQALVACMHAGWLDEVSQDGALVQAADRRVTWAQRLYLEAFDQTLRAGDDATELRRTSVLRSAALTGVYREAGKEQPWRQATAHPLARIAHTLERLGARDEAA